ncbi:Glycosyl hydrolase family 63 C-terminal domain-containing protein [Catalinimonas alkaloidigena]|uniref:Glycosyl hydrolase family 63 C-terminal domain-containing protein n=1 Tax=Catalinimonas alkaloidigena TaxID=1075417 RepID=A0A1G9HUI3_9BACT|nr:glucosidase [Catalinimonas alkaloidigena]SDL16621.1 Glycosyl hydrolase family 63 C-terminal domain-containing protein [Catalinimonas alkaloidigena]
MTSTTVEGERLAQSADNKNWKIWGPYLSDRQWGTVREDYSPHGDAWNCVPHDHARSNAYRWGEEGIAGFCDNRQILCLAPAFWNGRDPILKERLFGLTNGQGNHGEDVKELYFHLDSTPTHSYCKFLYKYPQREFPYNELVEKNRRSRYEVEYELLDTQAFDENRYFDCFVEYAKGGINDILMKITVVNRGPDPATIHVLPHLWFRNYWRHNSRYTAPYMRAYSDQIIQASSKRNGQFFLHHEGGEQLFCENETNGQRLYGVPNQFPYVKDGINDYVVQGIPAVNPEKVGTKSAVWMKATVRAGGTRTFRVRLNRDRKGNPWADFDAVFAQRQEEADAYYEALSPASLSPVRKKLLRSTMAGLLWTKQFYYLDVYKWLNGEPGQEPPFRHWKRNNDWQHLTNRNIISMPDKWEYPWYAAWDLAFHATSFVHVDPDFAKHQLLLMLREYYMHPNGQIPAYEWNFSDVNPPVHAWAVWQVYAMDKQKTGVPDWDFLERAFQKLLMNFTWWVNQKDVNGTDLFEGGFLGLDNIGVFDRSRMLPGIRKMQQADATSWMAMFSLNMLVMSLELAHRNPAYEEAASKFFRHFLNIAWAMHHIGKKDISLWDDKDNFYYDAVQLEDGSSHRLRIRSLVGIIPLLAVDIIHSDTFEQMREFRNRAISIIRTRPDLAELISHIDQKNETGDHLFSIMRGFRLEHLLKRMLDEAEFLSDYGVRSLSKIHLEQPYTFEFNGTSHVIHYEPGESTTSMFGGNSNWRGPIWFPLNYIIIKSLLKYYRFYGPTYIYEFPAGSGNKLNLKQIARELTLRLLKIFEPDQQGHYPYHAPYKQFLEDPHFRDHYLFYEFFHGDSGQGLGASHQTGWTALIANLLLEIDLEGKKEPKKRKAKAKPKKKKVVKKT